MRERVKSQPPSSPVTHHFQRVRLDENGLRERAIRRLRHEDALPGQGLDNPPVVEVVEVGVIVQVAQSHAVQLCIGQRVHNVRLQPLGVL